jgi:quinol-cytochrome oxidoreductase complex cytochrome b subunit
MEMVPNMAGEIPIVGDSLKAWLISFFTLGRAFIAHILLLPIICIILVDIHLFGTLRLRKGGIPRYLMRHGLIALPIVTVIAALAAGVQMPTEDPDIIPLPLEGRNVPSAEWYALVFFTPFRFFENWIAPTLGIYLPFTLFLLLTFAPFFLKRKPLAERKKSRFSPAMKKIVAFTAVTSTAAVLFLSLYSVSYRSPTYGCNSCHNIYMGRRMGIVPDEFKDREKLPLLDDNRWMVEHWFEPQQTW